MAVSAEQLNIILSARDKEFAKAMERSQKRVERFASKSQKDLTRTGKAFDVLSVSASKFAAVMSTTAVLYGIQNMIDQSTRLAKEVDNLSRISGTGVERFQELAFASKSVGIEQDKLADILKDVNDKFGDYLSTGAGPLADFFDNIAVKVGVTKEAFAGLSSDQALGLYIKTLQDAGVNQQQLTFYMEALASDATALSPLFLNNAQSLDTLAGAARELGVVIDADLIRKSVAMRNTWDQVMASMKSKFTTFALTVVKGFDAIFNISEQEQMFEISKKIAAIDEERATIAERMQRVAGNDKAPSGAMEMLTQQLDRTSKEKNDLIEANTAIVDNLQNRLMLEQTFKDLETGETFVPPASTDGGGKSKTDLASEYERLLSILDPLNNATREFAEHEKTINDLMAAGLISRAEGNRLMVAATQQLQEAAFEASGLSGIMDTVQSSMESAFMGMVDGTMSAKDAFKTMAADIIKELYRVLVVQRLVGAFSSGGGGIMGAAYTALGGKASGGSVMAGQAYTVGEHGREPFIPAQNGRILSTAQAKSAMAGGGGGGVTIVQNNTFGNGVNRAEINAMLPKIVEASKAAVLDARRRGGSYAGAF
jgi:hypothetical protein